MRLRMVCWVRMGALLALLSALGPVGLLPAGAAAETGTAPPALPGAPLLFVENAGQFAGGARFQVRGRDVTVWLAPDAVWLTLVRQAGGAHVRLSFPGGNPHPVLEPFGRLATHVAFLTGQEPSGWQTDVPTWGGVRYVDLYPGVDLVLTGESGRLLAHLVTRPGARLDAVRLRIEGAGGVAVEGDTLRLPTPAGDATFPLLRADRPSGKPTVRALGAQTFEIATPFSAEAGRSQSAASRLSSAPRDRPDDNPADMLYGTYLGGSLGETGYAIAVDGGGAAYVVGRTTSTGFPTTPGAFDTTLGGTADAFVTKLNAYGSALVYSTFLGGSSNELAYDIAVDASGAAYVTGYTSSGDFPTTPGAFDTGHNGSNDVFVTKLDPEGSALVYSTFLGGAYTDEGHGIAVDGNGVAYVAGTAGDGFPTTPGAYDRTHAGAGDVFVTAVGADGSALGYSTFVGGPATECGFAVAVDSGGYAYVTGYTASSNYPTTPGAFDTSHNGGGSPPLDAFLTKMNSDGSGLAYSTFLGGSGDDWFYSAGIAVDESGAAYVAGDTKSSNWPTTEGAFDPDYNGSQDAVVVKLNATGSDLVYSTYLGGSSLDWAYDLALDWLGAAYVIGDTNSSDFPTTPDAFDTSYNNSQDVYVSRLSADGSALDYSTFLGTPSGEGGHGIAADGSGAAYVTGYAGFGFPTTPGAYDTTHNGQGDVFVVKMAMGGPYCTLHLWKMKLNWGYAARPGYVKLVDSGIVHDQDHLWMAGATVSGAWTLPDGSQVTQQAVTDALGRFKFPYKAPWMAPGTYRLDVTGIEAGDCVYDPAANETPAYLEVTIPQP